LIFRSSVEFLFHPTHLGALSILTVEVKQQHRDVNSPAATVSYYSF